MLSEVIPEQEDIFSSSDIETFLNQDLSISDVQLDPSAFSPSDEIKCTILKIQDTISNLTPLTSKNELVREHGLTFRKEIERLKEIINNQNEKIDFLQTQVLVLINQSATMINLDEKILKIEEQIKKVTSVNS